MTDLSWCRKPLAKLVGLDDFERETGIATHDHLGIEHYKPWRPDENIEHAMLVLDQLRERYEVTLESSADDGQQFPPVSLGEQTWMVTFREHYLTTIPCTATSHRNLCKAIRLAIAKAKGWEP